MSDVVIPVVDSAGSRHLAMHYAVVLVVVDYTGRDVVAVFAHRLTYTVYQYNTLDGHSLSIWNWCP